MKGFTLICSLFLLVTFQRSQAQCSTCIPAFTTCPPAGGLCSHLDTAYANHPYDKQINFYMPATLNDPAVLAQCQCNYVELRVINVTGISGLPANIRYTLNNGGHYNVQGGDSIGCAHFCDTALVPGLYTISVHLLADVTAHGVPLLGTVVQNNNPQEYRDTLLVLPDTLGGVSSFTYGNNGSSACDSITVTLNALLTAPTPNLTRYFWNVAGQTTQVKTPGTFTFENISQTHPDTFPVTLTTVFYNYIVKKVHIAVITGGYCGDIEEATCSCISTVDSPDPYVKFGLLGFNNSGSYASNICQNVNFDNLNLSIPLGTQTLDMELWDKDNGPPFGSQDDLLGTYTHNVVFGQRNFSNNNVDGYIEFDTIAGTTITETLNVIVNPFPELPIVVFSQDTFCSSDSIRVSIDKTYNGYSFEWYRDTVYLSNATDSVFYSNKAGNYKVKVTNLSSGCKNESVFKKVTVMQSPPANINVVFNGTQSFPNPFPSSGFSVDWFYGGNLVTTQHGKFLPYLGDGLYEAQVYNTNFPACRTIANSKMVTTGIEETMDHSIIDLNIFPNPNSGKFRLSFTTEETQSIDIRIQNLLAQTVYQRKVENHRGDFNEEIDLGQFGKGIYLATFESAKGKQNKKVVIQ